MAVLDPEVTVLAGTSYSLTCQGTTGSAADGTTLEVEWFDGNGPPITSGDGLTIIGDSSTTDI